MVRYMERYKMEVEPFYDHVVKDDPFEFVIKYKI